MPTLDPRIDAYLDQVQPFALPILKRLREDVHAACPDIVEAVKWGMPHFTLDGKLLCGMAAFKAHCTFGFWEREGAGEGKSGAMGDFGRITSLADLPPRPGLRRQIKANAALLRAGAVRAKKPSRAPRTQLEMPADFAAALSRVQPAQQHYAAFPPGKRRDYLEWVLEAKRKDTRVRRIAQAVEWLAEGKSRNWKYESC
jgi:hypothetical protein